LAVAFGLATTAPAVAQMGQTGMAPSAGLVNNAISRFADLDANGPGWMYWGVNPADRGLGYVGSYMTLGGFIPYAEDDLGGLWSADLRSHLSVYGGFFSNVGMVRKQLLGGTLLGIGVYWDYDGDQNQFADTTISDVNLAGIPQQYTFAGGQTYQQVGVSGEWLTDFGNLRSNGYIPVGNTAQIMGNFVGNSLLAVNGINAALGGADLEVGAYIPGLSDWAGMVSVGGYALGNARYDLPNGQNVIPYFGGVYTRLDLTLIKNWDFSLQANNDSYFDWTGFARLTYRMGGSRRRTVTDQLEQPMMRNEHIVRAHQAPVQAINPATGSFWRVIHVDNSVPGGGDGTAARPFSALAAGHAAANQEHDIVYLHVGDSRTDPYVMRNAGGDPIPYTFQQNTQYLVGAGSSLRVPTVSNGVIRVSQSSARGLYPTISNPMGFNPPAPGQGTAIVLTDSWDPAVPGTTANATVSHVKIVGSAVGISDGGGLPASAAGPAGTVARATVNDVQIVGTGANQRGVQIEDRAGNDGTFYFSDMGLANLTSDGFFVDGTFGSPRVNIDRSQIVNTGGSAVYASNLFGPGRVRVANTGIRGSTGPAVHALNANLTVVSSTIASVGSVGVYAEDNSIVQVAGSTFLGNDISVHGTASAAGSLLQITVNDNLIIPASFGDGVVISAPNPASGAEVNAYIVRNRFVAQGDAMLLFDGTPGPGAAGTSRISIKAADEADLRRINGNASVRQVYPNNPTPLVPEPPNWNAALVVPLPAP
jgi:hypothetical protein